MSSSSSVASSSSFSSSSSSTSSSASVSDWKLFKRIKRNDATLDSVLITKAFMGVALLRNTVVSSLAIDVASLLSRRHLQRYKWGGAMDALLCYLQGSGVGGSGGGNVHGTILSQQRSHNKRRRRHHQHRHNNHNARLRKVKLFCSSSYKEGDLAANVAHDILQALACNPNLQELELDPSLRYCMDSLRPIFERSVSSRLDTLSMYCSFVDEQAFQDLAQMLDSRHRHSTLVTLSLLSAEPVVYLNHILKSINQHATLRHLSLQLRKYNNHTNYSYALLYATLVTNTSLESLTLSIDNIDTAISTCLEPLNRHPTLKQFTLEIETAMSPNDLIALLQSDEFCTKMTHVVATVPVGDTMDGPAWDALLLALRKRSMDAKFCLHWKTRCVDTIHISSSYPKRVHHANNDAAMLLPLLHPTEPLSKQPLSLSPPLLPSVVATAVPIVLQRQRISIPHPGRDVARRKLVAGLLNVKSADSFDNAIPIRNMKRIEFEYQYALDHYEMTSVHCLCFDRIMVNFMQQHGHLLNRLTVTNPWYWYCEEPCNPSDRFGFLIHQSSMQRRSKDPTLLQLLSTFVRQNDSLSKLKLHGFTDRQQRKLQACVARNRALRAMLMRQCPRPRSLALLDAAPKNRADDSALKADTANGSDDSSNSAPSEPLYPPLFCVAEQTPRAASRHLVAGLLAMEQSAYLENP